MGRSLGEVGNAELVRRLLSTAGMTRRRRVRLLGLDPGSSKVGIAVAQIPVQLFDTPTMGMPSAEWSQFSKVSMADVSIRPVTTVRRMGGDGQAEMIDEVVAIAKHFRIDGTIVGWPLRPDGSQGQRCRDTLLFLRDLGDAGLQGPITLWDERGSTVQARQWLRSNRGERSSAVGKLADEVAAAILLEGFADKWCGRGHGGMPE